MNIVMTNSNFLSDLFTFDGTGHATISSVTYLELVKYLYCSKKENPGTLSYDEVRENSMRRKRLSKSGGACANNVNSNCSNPQLWMPPASSMSKVADLINLQIEYLETAEVHEAQLPNFMSSGCLKKTSTGEIEYDLGPDAFSACPLKTIVSSPKKKTS